MTAATEAVRTTVLERDLYRCVSCGTYVGPFGDFSIHHRRPRGMGGTKRPESNLPGNLLLLCGSGTTGCHGWVESHRAEARDKGFLVWQSQDPETVPVETYCGSYYFRNDGTKEAV